MKRTSRFSALGSLVFVLALLLIVSGIVFSQEQTDEELKKKYGAFIGDYEFEFSRTKDIRKQKKRRIRIRIIPIFNR